MTSQPEPNADRRRRLEELFFKAADLEPAERQAFLDAAAHDDPTLRSEVLELLNADASQPDFLGGSAVDAHRDWFDTRSETASASPEEALPDHIGPYAIQRLLGEGGMGMVYLAEQPPPLQRLVAIKIVRAGRDTPEILARFEAERRTLALMNHSNIAKVYDSGVSDDGRPYFVMEYVDGDPITTDCDRRKVRLEARLRLFVKVCSAVQHAHQRATIHRDLKPSNILIGREGEHATPKIIDFGIAKATAPQGRNDFHTLDGSLVGTPEYMSPEQLDAGDEEIDTRTDIYALGVVLYELLVGALPFETLRDGGYGRLVATIRDAPAQRPTTRLQSLPEKDQGNIASSRGLTPARLVTTLRGDLEWITLKALEKDRARRYAQCLGTGGGYRMLSLPSSRLRDASDFLLHRLTPLSSLSSGEHRSHRRRRCAAGRARRRAP